MAPVARVNGISARAAALASSSSPSCQHRPAAPVGAIAIGRLISLPNSIVLVDRPDTSTRERCTSLIFSNAARLLRSASSSSVARSINSNTPLGRRRLAASRRSKTLWHLSSAAIFSLPLVGNDAAGQRRVKPSRPPQCCNPARTSHLWQGVRSFYDLPAVAKEAPDDRLYLPA